MNSKRTVLAAATAALLTAATVTAASAQTQERSSTRMNAGQNLSTGGQTRMNAQGPGANAGTQFQGGTRGPNQAANFSSQDRVQTATGNKYGMTSKYGNDRKYSGRRFDHDRGLAYSGRHFDQNRRVAYSGRVGYSGGYRDGGDRFAYGTNGGGWGWGGPSFGVAVGTGGWGWPGYGYGYDYGYPVL